MGHFGYLNIRSFSYLIFLARDFTQANPNNSFAPIRTNIKGSWFVDGSDYMSAVADVIEGAKEEIFITDWWLSPEIYLKRRVLNKEDYRLDRLLLKKAVCIIICT